MKCEQSAKCWKKSWAGRGARASGDRNFSFPIQSSTLAKNASRRRRRWARRARQETGGKAAVINEEKRDDVIEKWTVIINM